MGTLFDEPPIDQKQWRADLRGVVERRISEAINGEVMLPLDVVMALLGSWKQPKKNTSDRNEILSLYRHWFRTRIARGENRKVVLDELTEEAVTRLASYRDVFGEQLFARLSKTTAKRLIESEKPPGRKKRLGA